MKWIVILLFVVALFELAKLFNYSRKDTKTENKNLLLIILALLFPFDGLFR